MVHCNVGLGWMCVNGPNHLKNPPCWGSYLWQKSVAIIVQNENSFHCVERRFLQQHTERTSLIFAESPQGNFWFRERSTSSTHRYSHALQVCWSKLYYQLSNSFSSNTLCTHEPPIPTIPTLVCFISADLKAAFIMLVHSALEWNFTHSRGDDRRPSIRPSVSPSVWRVFRAGTKFCYALTSIDSQSECITELRPGTYWLGRRFTVWNKCTPDF